MFQEWLTGSTDIIVKAGAMGFMAVCLLAVLALAGNHFFGTPKPGQYRMAVTIMAYSLVMAAGAAFLEFKKAQQSYPARDALTRIQGEVNNLNETIKTKWCNEVSGMPEPSRTHLGNIISTLLTSTRAIEDDINNKPESERQQNLPPPTCPDIPASPSTTHESQR